MQKVVLISGASSGIGKALAIRFYDMGYRIALIARRIEKLNELKQELNAPDTAFLGLKCDVRIEDDCRQAVKQVEEVFGRIDILICNAGISMRALFSELRLDVFRQVMDVNFMGTVNLTKFALPLILKNHGSVAGVSSIAGYTPLPGRTAYCASKYAMHGFLKTLGAENIKNGLHVLIAAPGFTASEIREHSLTATGKPQGKSPREESKMMSAEYVAEKIYNAIIKRRRNLILGNEGKISILLHRLFPSLHEKILYKYMAKEKDSPLDN